MDVPFDFMIIDKREKFSKNTFSNYKKLDVIKQLNKALENGNLESVCYWYIELHISGFLNDIWKIIFNTTSNIININNPHLPSWLWLKYQKYQKLLKTFKKGFEYETRNNQEMRNLFIDIFTVLTFSKKNKILDSLPKITDKDLYKDRIITKIVGKSYNCDFINPHEHQEIKIAVNEFIHHMTQNLTKVEDAFYWILWLEKVEKFKKKNSIDFTGNKKTLDGVSEKNSKDWIWIFWLIILDIDIVKNDINLNKAIQTLYNIYVNKFTSSSKPTRHNIFFHACLLIKCYDQVNWNQSLIDKYYLRIQACCNINQMYKVKRIDKMYQTDFIVSNKNNRQIPNVKEEKLNQNYIKSDDYDIKNTVEEIQKNVIKSYGNKNKYGNEINIDTRKVNKQSKEKYKIKSKKNNENEEFQRKMQKKINIYNKIVFYK